MFREMKTAQRFIFHEALAFNERRECIAVVRKKRMKARTKKQFSFSLLYFWYTYFKNLVKRPSLSYYVAVALGCIIQMCTPLKLLLKNKAKNPEKKTRSFGKRRRKI